jgi:hypothetical protein
MKKNNQRVSRMVREIVANRAAHRCEYCQCPEEYAIHSFTIEHIFPRQLGGTNALDNLAWSCSGCNSYKHTKTRSIDPHTGQIVKLFNPRLQRWRRHFSWSSDYTQVVGKTRCGRATVEALQLNRKGAVNLRRLLVKDDRHPPDIGLKLHTQNPEL